MAKKPAKQPQTWRNRIVGHDVVSPEQLLAHPNNARVHPKAQREALRGAIGDIGFTKSVTVTKDGTVVDGHLRVALALSEKQPTIPVEIVDLTDEEVKEALLTTDPISATAAYDKAQLDALLRDVNTGDAALQTMLADLAQNNGIEYGDTPNFLPAGADEQGRLDQKAPVKCPHCGAEFQP